MVAASSGIFARDAYLHFSKSRKAKQISSENCDRFWRDYWFGRVDH